MTIVFDLMFSKHYFRMIYVPIRPLRSNKLNYLSNSNSNGQKSYLSGSKQ